MADGTEWWERNRGYVMYPIASSTYVCIGLTWKPLLNWVLGPLWIVLVVGVLPDLLDRRQRRRAAP